MGYRGLAEGQSTYPDRVAQLHPPPVQYTSLQAPERNPSDDKKMVLF